MRMRLRSFLLTKKSWAEAEVSWLPLAQAIFAFGISADDMKPALYDMARYELTKVDSSKIDTTRALSPIAFSIRQLTQMLQEKSGARKAEIDPIRSTFAFSFDDTEILAGPPWAILDEPRETAQSPDAILAPGAVLNTDGIVSINDKGEVTRHKKRFQSVREATGLVWRQFIRRAFDHAVITEAVTLYARRGATSADFGRLPNDVWRLLEVADWQNGLAIAPDGTRYWSIHGQQYAEGAKSSGRKKKVDWDGFIKPQVFELLDHHGWPDAADPEWKSQADVEAKISAITGEALAESTVRKYVAQFMAEWRRAKAGN